jgi:pilus assembly protein CpaF
VSMAPQETITDRATPPLSPGTRPADLDDEVHRHVLRTHRTGPAPTASSVETVARQLAPLLGAPDIAALVERTLARTGGMGPLEPLFADPEVSDIMANGPGPVWIERAGRLSVTGIVLDGGELDRLIARVLAPLGRRVDRTAPMADARLPDGSRVNVVVPPLAVDGACLTIRRFAARAVPLSGFAGPEVVRLLRWAVAARWNIVVSGGAGAGKTTLLNALAAELPAHERVVTVEDAAELRLPGDHVVRLEARPATAEGVGAVTIRDLVRNALRMRPDRIVIGECRGGEALDALQAMNTGHEGSLSTCHANGPDDALRRLETMVLMAGAGLPLAAVRQQVGAAVDLVIHVARGHGGERRVVAVAEVQPGDPPATRRLADGQTITAAPTRPARRAGVQ